MGVCRDQTPGLSRRGAQSRYAPPAHFTSRRVPRRDIGHPSPTPPPKARSSRARQPLPPKTATRSLPSARPQPAIAPPALVSFSLPFPNQHHLLRPGPRFFSTAMGPSTAKSTATANPFRRRRSLRFNSSPMRPPAAHSSRPRALSLSSPLTNPMSVAARRRRRWSSPCTPASTPSYRGSHTSRFATPPA